MQKRKHNGFNGKNVEVSTLNYAVSITSDDSEDNITALCEHALRLLEYSKKIEEDRVDE